MVKMVNMTEKKAIALMTSLNRLVFSTYIPKAAEPLKPPMIKRAPNTAQSSYTFTS